MWRGSVGYEWSRSCGGNARDLTVWCVHCDEGW